jgi:hypothetical protein
VQSKTGNILTYFLTGDICAGRVEQAVRPGVERGAAAAAGGQGRLQPARTLPLPPRHSPAHHHTRVPLLPLLPG